MILVVQCCDPFFYQHSKNYAILRVVSKTLQLANFGFIVFIISTAVEKYCLLYSCCVLVMLCKV